MTPLSNFCVQHQVLVDLLHSIEHRGLQATPVNAGYVKHSELPAAQQVNVSWFPNRELRMKEMMTKNVTLTIPSASTWMSHIFPSSSNQGMMCLFWTDGFRWRFHLPGEQCKNVREGGWLEKLHIWTLITFLVHSALHPHFNNCKLQHCTKDTCPSSM